MTAPVAGDTVQYRSAPDHAPVSATIIEVRMNRMVDIQVGADRMDAVPFIQTGQEPPRWGGFAAWPGYEQP